MNQREIEEIQKRWAPRGFHGGVWIDPPGQVWKDYRHDTEELFLVLEGEVELEMKGRKFRPKIGEEILIPAGVLHTVRNVGDRTSRWLYAYQ